MAAQAPAKITEKQHVASRPGKAESFPIPALLQWRFAKVLDLITPRLFTLPRIYLEPSTNSKPPPNEHQETENSPEPLSPLLRTQVGHSCTCCFAELLVVQLHVWRAPQASARHLRASVFL